MNEPTTASAPSAPSQPSAPAPEAKASQPETKSSQPSPATGSADPAPKPGETAAQAAARVKLALNLRGKQEEREFSQEELTKWVQLGLVSGTSLREAKELEKRAKAEREQHLERLKSDPWAALQELGLDPDQLAEARIQRRLERELASPEARRAAEAEERLARLEAEREAELSAREEQEQSLLAQRYAEQYQQEILRVLPTVKGIPQGPDGKGDPEVIQRVAYYIHEALQREEDLPVQEALALVQEDYRNIFTGAVQGLDGAALAELLGAEAVDRIRRWDLQRLKGAPQAPPSGTRPTTGPAPAQQPPAGMSPSEWREWVRSRL